MHKYIDADALKEELQQKVFDNYTDEFWGTMQVVDDMPAADVEPVRHGYWKYDPNAMDYNLGGYRCSECGTRNNNLPGGEQYARMIMTFRGALYCPNCGAKMDGGNEE